MSIRKTTILLRRAGTMGAQKDCLAQIVWPVLKERKFKLKYLHFQ
jgi:hypothetical protein